MSLTPAMIDAMIVSGCTAEQIAAVVKIDLQDRERAIAERRARDAERQRKSRASHGKSRNVTVTPSDECDPPNDIYSNPPVSPSSANADDAPPPIQVRFVSAWNAEGGLRPARPLSGQRLTKFRRRLKEFGEEGLLDAVRRLGASPFHCGKNDREWQADIGWFIKSDDNVTKALELPDPGKPAAPTDLLESAERTAALYRRMGRDDDAEAAEKRAARLRAGATGPPRSLGEIVQRAAGG